MCWLDDLVDTGVFTPTLPADHLSFIPRIHVKVEES